MQHFNTPVSVCAANYVLLHIVNLPAQTDLF